MGVQWSACSTPQFGRYKFDVNSIQFFMCQETKIFHILNGLFVQQLTHV